MNRLIYIASIAILLNTMSPEPYPYIPTLELNNDQEKQKLEDNYIRLYAEAFNARKMR